MCVIIVKEHDKPLASKAILEKSWKLNSDGGGFFILKAGETVGKIRKGFMTFADFMKALEAEKPSKEDLIIYHFRIYTSGGRVSEKTHPFPITDMDDALNSLSVDGTTAFIHNGVFHGYKNERDKGLSDSQLFVKETLHPLLERYRKQYNTLLEAESKIDKTSASVDQVCSLETIKNAKKRILDDFSEEYAKLCQSGSNRTVVIDTTMGLFLLTGNWQESEGLKFSNSGPISKSWSYPSSDWSRQPSSSKSSNDKVWKSWIESYPCDDDYDDVIDPYDYPIDSTGEPVIYCEYCGAAMDVPIKKAPLVYCPDCEIVKNALTKEVVWQK